MPSPQRLLPLWLLIFSLPLLADEAADFRVAEAVFQRAVAGQTSATDEAVNLFARLAAQNPSSAPLYLAYQGAAQTLQGRDAWLPWNKLHATERGLATLDKALRLASALPDHAKLHGIPIVVALRLTAASTFLALPDFFHRLDDAKDILRATLDSPAFAQTPSEVRAQVYRQAAIAASRSGNHKEEANHLRQALLAAPDAPWAAATRQQLQELKP